MKISLLRLILKTRADKFAGALEEILGVTFWPYNKFFIDQTCSVKMAGCWPLSILPFLWISTSSRSIKTQKITWPISSHLDLTLGQ